MLLRGKSMSHENHNYFSDVTEQEYRIHPLVNFWLMSLMWNGALLLGFYMLFDGFKPFHAVLMFFLLLSWLTLYRTA